jgi:hypothetical protein
VVSPSEFGFLYLARYLDQHAEPAPRESGSEELMREKRRLRGARHKRRFLMIVASEEVAQSSNEEEELGSSRS